MLKWALWKSQQTGELKAVANNNYSGLCNGHYWDFWGTFVDNEIYGA